MDCLPLVERIRGGEEDYTETGIICRRIVELLQASGSSKASIEHVRRTANNAAHIMAHSETHWECREVWIDRPPIFLVDQLLLDDVTGFT
ncbi:unnamed protein product [Linum tenue]|uniref:RNase H type-1 domain-containing protein n=1 Tax=Linum tenue TaxID=586396 RepID=A0AAV0MRW0_9ROSI|nr:unnamed protein product [Linum tenue]